MLFFVDSGALHSYVGDKVFERLFRHSGRISIPKIDSRRDFKFGDTLVRSRGMVELMIPTPGSTFDRPVILDAINVETAPLLGLDVLDGSNGLVYNVTNHLWSRIITNRDPLRFKDI